MRHAIATLAFVLLLALPFGLACGGETEVESDMPDVAARGDDAGDAAGTDVDQMERRLDQARQDLAAREGQGSAGSDTQALREQLREVTASLQEARQGGDPQELDRIERELAAIERQLSSPER